MMTLWITYDVQTRRNDVWSLQASFDDPLLALYEARRLGDARQHEAVRAVRRKTDAPDEAAEHEVIYSDDLTTGPAT